MTVFEKLVLRALWTLIRFAIVGARGDEIRVDLMREIERELGRK